MAFWERGERMRRHNMLFWLGLVLYGAAFFLPSIQMMGRGFSGWFCATFALTQPWESPGSLLRHQNFFEYSILIAGLISPLFVITMALVFSQRCGQLFRILRIALLSMTPFCWIAFYYLK